MEPAPSHQKAGVPKLKAMPIMPSVAEAPTQDTSMEAPTFRALPRLPFT
jgi:hypothetical protein